MQIYSWLNFVVRYIEYPFYMLFAIAVFLVTLQLVALPAGAFLVLAGFVLFCIVRFILRLLGEGYYVEAVYPHHALHGPYRFKSDAVRRAALSGGLATHVWITPERLRTGSRNRRG
jgi:hypothetical protein